MRHLGFIVAAYGLTIAGTIGVLWWSYVSMRRAERRAEAIKARK